MGKEEESPLEFPCEFPLSVIGYNRPEFAVMVMDIVRKHVPSLEATDYSLRLSRDAHYLSVKVNFTAESRQQLDNLYRELTLQEDILWVL